MAGLKGVTEWPDLLETNSRLSKSALLLREEDQPRVERVKVVGVPNPDQEILILVHGQNACLLGPFLCQEC